MGEYRNTSKTSGSPDFHQIDTERDAFHLLKFLSSTGKCKIPFRVQIEQLHSKVS